MGVRVQISNGKLDPILPGALRHHLSDSDWNSLQEALWYELSPAVSHKSCVGYVRIMLLVGFLVQLCLFPILGLAENEATVTIPLDMILLALLVQLASFFYSYCYLKPTIKAGVETVLRKFSQVRPNTTFHLVDVVTDSGGYSCCCCCCCCSGDRREIVPVDYILEISVKEGGGYRLTLDMGDIGKTKEKQETVTERLQNLDSVKYLLSDKEYSDKRLGILELV
jgi:hypothetical protein